MSSDPFVYNVPRKLSNSELASAIRLDIQAELDATSLYQAHYDATDDEQAKAVLAHIRDEEKEHAAEFIQLLAMLDPYQAEELRAASKNVSDIISAGGVSGTAPGETPGPGGGQAGREGMTVGSLIGEAQS